MVVKYLHDPDSTQWQKFVVKAYDFYVENFLVICFAVAVTTALTFPSLGSHLAMIKFIHHHHYHYIRIVQFMNNAAVFLISGLQIRVEDLRNILKSPSAILYGIVTINFLTTASALIMTALPFNTREFAQGFTIFSIVPTTLGIGVSLTNIAGGDQALALILTVTTNILGIFTIPYLLHIYLGGTQNIHFDPSTLILNRIFAVLIPTLIGITSRNTFKSIESFIIKYNVLMRMISSLNIVCIVWMAISSARDTILKQSITELLILVLVAVIQHITYLIFNYHAVKWLNFPLLQSIAITIMSSQKSSPVALTVIVGIHHNPTTIGLMTIPCVIGQLSQIFIGYGVAKHFKHIISIDHNRDNSYYHMNNNSNGNSQKSTYCSHISLYDDYTSITGSTERTSSSTDSMAYNGYYQLQDEEKYYRNTDDSSSSHFTDSSIYMNL